MARRGYYLCYGSCRRWSWAELATSSLEGLDIFYVHITRNRFVDWVRIYMNINAYIMSIDATIPVFRVSDKIIPKTKRLDRNSEVSLGASLNTILFNL